MPALPFGLYQHYKGNYYNVIGLGRHSETLEESEAYQAQFGDQYLMFHRYINP